MIGNSKNTAYRNGDLGDGSLLFHIHYPNWGFMTKNGLSRRAVWSLILIHSHNNGSWTGWVKTSSYGFSWIFHMGGWASTVSTRYLIKGFDPYRGPNPPKLGTRLPADAILTVMNQVLCHLSWSFINWISASSSRNYTGHPIGINLPRPAVTFSQVTRKVELSPSFPLWVFISCGWKCPALPCLVQLGSPEWELPPPESVSALLPAATYAASPWAKVRITQARM